MLLSTWLDGVASYRFNPYAAIKVIHDAVYIPDCPDIAQSRTQLWDLEDYRVTSVTGGSIVLIHRIPFNRPLVIVICADCGRHHDANGLPSHECSQQYRENKRMKGKRS